MIVNVNRNLQLFFFTAVFLSCLGGALWYEQDYLLAIPFGILIFLAGWKNINIVLFLLLFTLPFSTEWQINAELGTDFPDELLMLLTAGLAICFWIYSFKELPQKLIFHPLILLVVITMAWAFVTIFSSDYPLVSIKYLLAKCWYIGAFVLAPLIVFRSKNSIKTGSLILAITMLAVVVICLVRHSQYGFSFAEINNALRPFFRNHVNYSAMLVCLVPVFFAFFKLSRSKVARTIIVLAIMILLAALFLSYARGAWLALVIGLTAYWLVKRKLLLVVYVSTVIVAIAGLIWLRSNDRYLQYANNYRATIFHEDFREHLQATYHLKDLSTAERFYRWIAGVRMVSEKPITGFGPNTFYNNYKAYTIPAFKTWVSNNKEHSTVHNYFLLMAVEQGIPGLLFFIILVGAMIGYAQKLYHRVPDAFYKQIAITIAVILVMILTVNSLSDLVETDKIGSLFYLCLSLLIITDVTNRKDQSDPSPDIQRIS